MDKVTQIIIVKLAQEQSSKDAMLQMERTLKEVFKKYTPESQMGRMRDRKLQQLSEQLRETQIRVLLLEELLDELF